jgi:DNA-binding GntR family transcriptional regulator
LLDFAETTRLEVKHVGGVSSDSKLFEGFSDITPGRWLRVAGLRLIRGEKTPLCWAEILVPEKFSPPRDQIINSTKAIYEEIMAHNGFRLEYVQQEVTASLLPLAMQPLFGVEESSAALLVTRRYVAHTGETFEVSQNLYPANRYRIQSIIRQRA